MKGTFDARDERKDNCPEQEFTEERFLAQFASLEESLALIQVHMHSMSANAKLFGSLARHIRRSTCPPTMPLPLPFGCARPLASAVVDVCAPRPVRDPSDPPGSPFSTADSPEKKHDKNNNHA